MWRHFQHRSTLNRSRLKMQQDIRSPNAETNFSCMCIGMIAICPHQIWWRWVHESFVSRIPQR